MKTKFKQKRKNKIKVQFIFNKNSKEHKYRFKHKNTCPNFLAFSCPFLSTKHKNTNTNTNLAIELYNATHELCVSPPPTGRLEVSPMVPLVMKSALLVLEVPGDSDYSG